MLRRLGAEIYLREMWRREVVSWPCSSTNTPLPQTDPLLHEARNLLKQKLICEWFCGSQYLLQGVDLREIEASRLSSTTTQPTSHSQNCYGFKRTIWVEIYTSKITINVKGASSKWPYSPLPDQYSDGNWLFSSSFSITPKLLLLYTEAAGWTASRVPFTLIAPQLLS